MVLDVGNVLDSAQRTRVLAMQKTAGQLDDAFLRLATGQKVSSAIDNPGSYFLARSLRNRAGDLSRLLDSIGQNIRAIQVADHGIKAGLDILDLAESYLLDIEKKYMAGEVGTGADLPAEETHVTFSGPADLIRYINGQDAPASGPVVVPSPNEVQFNGNLWKRKAFNYTVTENTVLVFEYRSTLIPEVSTIGFDNDTNFNNDDNRFWLHGTQFTGITYAAPASTFAYSGSGDWERIEIPVGEYFTGSFTHMTFVSDDDTSTYGNSAYRNITLREAPVQSGFNGEGFEKEYARIVSQLDQLVRDAHYRGINLLKGDDMTTYFNPAHTSKLITEGIDATYAGLGLDINNFNSVEAVRAKIEQVRVARKILRSFGSTLAHDLNIIRIRDEFTRAQINNAKSGADDLTNADPNEEGAKVLALQTRQQLQSVMLGFRPANILSILS